ncbi:hypothetical protein COU17_00995 [Candidatus Kaiserbacteria bacterium CG10_big_fil_rev_8_21_14_0_10_49_17]|uniref:Phenylalanine--tRNA ligase beta subunit n=1 Tax=Candidatus Kaiserbacteria bacterium CG10_big_fil_rev_8_21_14_0_10_49_17 TaxID=1974609 RepID=A0A2M6WF40_9BACT|nr:MAG: hypothetical protein COU17_00995 [Candidatus Kaiserbacteria bacterium CG10_big_fil_rev_8_21_14_0_10_49_17]
MKISHDWLQSFFEKPLPSAEEIERSLTFHSFEIEGVERKGGDSVIDVDVLANRAHDCLCHFGIAKEVSTVLSIPLIHDPLTREIPLAPESNMIDVSVESSSQCPRYAAAVIRGIEVKESPEWLRNRLEAIGQRSINAVVDATNYVMFHLGQPLHAFDMDKLADADGNASITVRLAREGERITLLGGDEHALSREMQLITNTLTGTPIALAGVKGGIVAEVDSKTTNIVIESANFDPISTRKTAQALKLQTDASKRYENGISPELAGAGLAMAVELIQQIAGGVLEGFADEYPQKVESWQVRMRASRLNTLLGTNISNPEIEDIFTRLNFQYKREGGDIYTVTPPFERLDLQIEEDLIEEVGRIFGYENIPEHAPEQFEVESINKSFYYAERIREALRKIGYSEVYTYSLVKAGEIKTENALASDKQYLRASLAPALADELERNTRILPVLGVDAVRIFEIGTVFTKEGEHTALAIASSKNSDDAQKAVADVLGISVEWSREGDVWECTLSAQLKKLPDPESYEGAPVIHAHSYSPFSPYPFALRDIAVWTPEGTAADMVLETIAEEAGELLVSATLFDEFSKDGRTSFAYRLVFQSHDRTLTDEEINTVMRKVEGVLNDTSGFEVR